MLNSLERLSLKWIFLLAALPLVFSALLNPGFMASDEYWTAITRYIPAQTSTAATLLREDDVKGPLQLLPMHLVAQGSLAAGVEHPYWQYRITIAVLALIGVGLLLGAARNFSRDETETKILLLLLGFYFASPAILTRPMFESLAAPFLAWAGLWAVRYDQEKTTKALLWGALCAAVAFALRPQAGVCALIFPLLALWHRQWKQLAIVAVWGLTLIVLTGLPDLWLRGSFHHSLRALISYNVEFGGDYGSQPVYYYLPILFLMFFGPWLFARYDEKAKQDIFLRSRALWIMIAIFVLEHSLFTHKFERFMFPLIPIVLFLLAPILLFFLRTGRKRRLISLLIFNFILWVPATFSVAQGHLIGLVRYLDVHPEITGITNVNEALSWTPDVFRQNGKTSRLDMRLEDLSAQGLPCGIGVVVHEPLVAEIQKIQPQYEVIESFRPGLIEYLAFKLNPKHNIRRAPLALMGCHGS